MNDYNFEAKIAVRENVPALIALWGGTGCGKTYSALLLARGLAGKDEKILLLDTENGRAKFYSDIDQVGQWFHVDIQPPFTPDKYTAAVKFAQKHGAKTIIVDSASHVWQGEGGVLEMADSNKAKGQLKWKDPKMAHQRMMNALCRSRVNMIFCLRQKDAMKTVKIDGKDQYVFDKHMPIAEKNFIFEMTVALRMTSDGYYDRPLIQTEAADHSRETYYKVPAGLKDIVPIGGRVTVEMGEKIATWLASGEQRDEEKYDLIDRALEVAAQGMKAYENFFTKELTKEQRAKIQSRHDGFKKIAEDVDAERQAEEDYANGGAAFTKNDVLSKGHKCVTCNDRGLIETADTLEPCPECKMHVKKETTTTQGE